MAHGFEIGQRVEYTGPGFVGRRFARVVKTVCEGFLTIRWEEEVPSPFWVAKATHCVPA